MEVVEGRIGRARVAASWARALLVPGAGPCGGAFSNVHGKRRECTKGNGANLRENQGRALQKTLIVVLSVARP